MKRAAQTVYCLDADALVNIQIHYPKAIRIISTLARGGVVVIPEGIYRELRRKTDRLKNTVETWYRKHSAVKSLNTSKQQAELARMEREYGEKIVVGDKARRGFWHSKSGREAKDSQVVALAKVNGYVAVSNDQAIQDACQLEDVQCIGWQEFYRRAQRGLTGQASLFE